MREPAACTADARPLAAPIITSALPESVSAARQSLARGNAGSVEADGPEIPAWGYPGETEGSVQGSPWFHAEVFLTRRVRDGLAVRLGVTFTPLLYVPMTAQPLVMSVWQF